MVVRELRLKYADVQGRLNKTSRLTGIKECAGDGAGDSCLPETVFDWDVSTPGFETAESYTLTLESRSDRGILTHQPADINGDGVLDLVWLESDRDGTDTDHHLK